MKIYIGTKEAISVDVNYVFAITLFFLWFQERASMGKHTGNLRMSAHAYGSLDLQKMAEVGGEGNPEDPGPVSFADFGIPQPPKLQNTLLGKVLVRFTFYLVLQAMSHSLLSPSDRRMTRRHAEVI